MNASAQTPTLGAHTHAHAHAHPYPWVLGGHGCDVIVHGWASVLCIPASSSKSESKFSDARKMLRVLLAYRELGACPQDLGLGDS